MKKDNKCAGSHGGTSEPRVSQGLTSEPRVAHGLTSEPQILQPKDPDSRMLTLHDLKALTQEGQDECTNTFHTRCHVQDKVCVLIIAERSSTNLVSSHLVDELQLAVTRHPSPYRLHGVTKNEHITINRQCRVSFSIGKYRDEILCDVVPMEIGHILLGRPWQIDRHAVHDELTNKYSFLMNKKRIVLVPLSPHEISCEQKLLKQEFEKRHKGKAKEPHEYSEREASATPVSSSKEKEDTECPLRVPEEKHELKKKEGNSVSQASEWSLEPIVSKHFVGKRDVDQATHSGPILLLHHQNSSSFFVSYSSLQGSAITSIQECFEAPPATSTERPMGVTRYITGTFSKDEDPWTLETRLAKDRILNCRPHCLPSLQTLFPVDSFLFLNFVSNNFPLCMTNPERKASLPRLYSQKQRDRFEEVIRTDLPLNDIVDLILQDPTEILSRTDEITSTQCLLEGDQLILKERIGKHNRGSNLIHYRQGSHNPVQLANLATTTPGWDQRVGQKTTRRTDRSFKRLIFDPGSRKLTGRDPMASKAILWSSSPKLLTKNVGRGKEESASDMDNFDQPMQFTTVLPTHEVTYTFDPLFLYAQEAEHRKQEDRAPTLQTNSRRLPDLAFDPLFLGEQAKFRQGPKDRPCSEEDARSQAMAVLDYLDSRTNPFEEGGNDASPGSLNPRTEQLVRTSEVGVTTSSPEYQLREERSRLGDLQLLQKS